MVENSGGCGVAVWSTERSTMKNCNISHSKLSGLSVGNGGLMTIDGNDTTIHQNCTSGVGYGLDANDSADSIHLVSPLTKEMISTNNHRRKTTNCCLYPSCRNYSGNRIQTITNKNTK